MALVIAMGVGRFAYTPLLPAIQNQFGFSEEIAGSIASVNYLGYHKIFPRFHMAGL